MNRNTHRKRHSWRGIIASAIVGAPTALSVSYSGASDSLLVVPGPSSALRNAPPASLFVADTPGNGCEETCKHSTP